MRMNMKKLLIVLLLIGVGSGSSAVAGTGEFGFSAGINRTSLDYEDTFDVWSLNKRNLFNLTAIFELPIYKNLNIQTGIRYYKIGNDVDLDFSGTPGKQIEQNFKITQNYLALPARIKFSIFNQPTFYVHSGLEIGYLLSASTEVVRSDQSTTEEDIKNTLHKTNLNALIGAGIEFDLSRIIIFMESYYAYGLTDIPKKDEWLFNWQTRELSFIFGFKFRLN